MRFIRPSVLACKSFVGSWIEDGWAVEPTIRRVTDGFLPESYSGAKIAPGPAITVQLLGYSFRLLGYRSVDYFDYSD